MSTYSILYRYWWRRARQRLEKLVVQRGLLVAAAVAVLYMAASSGETNDSSVDGIAVAAKAITYVADADT